MKKLVLYFFLVTTIFATELIDGRYSVVENVIRGKKWRSYVAIEVKKHEIANIYYDMVTKDGDKISRTPEIDRIIEEADGINPFEELPNKYLEKRKKTSNPYLARIDTIAGATVITSKFNNMMLFLMKKSEKGDTGDFKGWFN